MVTFSPQPRCNPPPLNDLASRSNEYLTSKRFFLTTLLVHAIERREDRAPARSAPFPRTPPFQIPPFRRVRWTFRISNSSTEPSRTDLSPLSPHCYKLFVVAKTINSLVFSQFHTLVAKTPGWRCPFRLQASSFKPPDRTSRLQNRTKP